jgi:hypothetical protein
MTCTESSTVVYRRLSRCEGGHCRDISACSYVEHILVYSAVVTRLDIALRRAALLVLLTPCCLPLSTFAPAGPSGSSTTCLSMHCSSSTDTVAASSCEALTQAGATCRWQRCSGHWSSCCRGTCCISTRYGSGIALQAAAAQQQFNNWVSSGHQSRHTTGHLMQQLISSCSIAH